MLLTSLVRGEHALFLSAHYDDIVVARKGGAPVKFLKPQDGVRVGRNSQSIIKNAPHPNAAKLWVEWSLSEPGQQVLGAHGLVPTRKGVAAAVPEANLTGVKLLPIAETKQDMTYLKERTKRMETLFFKKN